ncbi:MAG TPA: L,D-transpeptidase family protein [Allosphingosinicella sp.]|jgi:murein L,D-transpeptidase YcbB/YkuD
MRPLRATHACNLASAGLSLLAVTTMLFAIGGPAAGSQTEETASPAAAPAPGRPAGLWSASSIAALQAEIEAAAAEGLEPEAYNAAALRGIGEGPEADRLATSLAIALAQDYARGRIEDASRFGWHIQRNDADANSLGQQLYAALRQDRLRPWLRSLLPTDARYAALRTAYASASGEPVRAKLRANMERWRWMPRSLGADHIYVNVPSYTLSVVEDGRPVSAYTVVVGSPSTPTPQIAVEAQSVVVNPWWNVPRSIARNMKAGGNGYVYSRGSIRQRPGPRNALGKVKIDMPNPHSIYLHDTPSKSLFAEKSRAFSHGCIRVKDIDRLAVELMELDRGETAEVQKALAGSATRTVKLQQRRPVYLVYFTMDVAPDGRLVTLEDPYGRDTKLIAGLQRETQLASAQLRSSSKTRA